jgi:hypothetical protein
VANLAELTFNTARLGALWKPPFAVEVTGALKPGRHTLAGYLGARIDVKHSTAVAHGHTRRCLVDYFGSDKPLHEITSGEADPVAAMAD